MAEKDPRHYVEQYDSQLTDVMPDNWLGHARTALMQKDLSEKEYKKALRHSRNILSENPEYPASTVAEKIVEKME